MPRRSYEAYRASKLSSAARRPSIIESETDADSLASFSTFNSSSTSYLASPAYSYSPHRPSPPAHSGSSSRITPPPRPSLTPQSHSASTSASSPGASSASALGALGLSHLDAAAPAPRLRPRTFSSSSSLASASHSPSLAPLLEQPLGPGGTSGEPAPPRSASQTRHGSSLLPPAFSSRGRSPTSLEERDKRRRKREERFQKSTLRGEAFDSPLRRAIRNLSVQGKSQWGLVIAALAVGLLRAFVVLLSHRGDDGRVDPRASLGMVSALLNLPGLRLLRDTIHSHASPRLASALQLFCEGAMWWTAVVAWITTEAKRGGRSWRTQLTGITTVLLCPAFLVLSNASPRLLTTLGAALWSFVLFARENDTAGCLALAVSTLLEGRMLWYLPAACSYLAGKSLYTGGKQGAIRAVFNVTALAPILGVLLCSPASLSGGAAANAPHEIRSTVQMLHLPWVSREGEGWLYTVVSIVAVIPTVLIILYTSLSFRSSQSTKTASSPTIRLLIPALVASSLPSLLFSPGPGIERHLVPLMPLSMMMALRGGKESGQSENETWEIGVLLNNVVALSSMPHLRPLAQAEAALSMALWNWTIGYAPQKVQSSWIRTTGLAAYPALCTTLVVRLLASRIGGLAVVGRVAAWAGGVTCFGVFFSAYLWSNKRLIESAWALSGLGLGEGKKAL